ncbi:MAG: lipoprotein signal peptidase [Flavobacteriaceae bacterium]
MNLKKSVVLIALILVVDQLVKLYIKLNFSLGEYINVFGLSWFEIRFVENPGMAWGSKLSDFLPISEPFAKVFLTSFRLVAIGFIGYWLHNSIKKAAPNLLIVSIALIFAGAFGNNIDSLFYGLIFDSGTVFNVQYNDWIGYTGVSQMSGDGYSGMMQGCVVDMLRFPFTSWTWPEWMPVLGGNHFTFFDPVFNIADMAISTGVGILLVFNKKVFPQPLDS